MLNREDVQHKNARVDLHIHSIYSDGRLEISQIIESALRANLKAIAITDHDNIEAIAKAQQMGKSLGIEVISGVELSTELENKDIHVLGYGFDHNNTELRNKLSEFKEARYNRAKNIVKNLNKLGLDLRFDTVEKFAGEGCMGRPHIAEAMVKEELVSTYKEAFEKHIGYDSPAYVEKMHFLPSEAFKLINKAGGVTILAHPLTTRCDEKIPEFIKQGLNGIEVWHPEHNQESHKHYLEYCKSHNLIYTGGTDCHGFRRRKPLIGSLPIPYECVELIKKTCNN